MDDVIEMRIKIYVKSYTSSELQATKKTATTIKNAVAIKIN